MASTFPPRSSDCLNIPSHLPPDMTPDPSHRFLPLRPYPHLHPSKLCHQLLDRLQANHILLDLQNPLDVTNVERHSLVLPISNATSPAFTTLCSETALWINVHAKVAMDSPAKIIWLNICAPTITSMFPRGALANDLRNIYPDCIRMIFH